MPFNTELSAAYAIGHNTFHAPTSIQMAAVASQNATIPQPTTLIGGLCVFAIAHSARAGIHETLRILQQLLPLLRQQCHPLCHHLLVSGCHIRNGLRLSYPLCEVRCQTCLFGQMSPPVSVDLL